MHWAALDSTAGNPPGVKDEEGGCGCSWLFGLSLFSTDCRGFVHPILTAEKD